MYYTLLYFSGKEKQSGLMQSFSYVKMKALILLKSRLSAVATSALTTHLLIRDSSKQAVTCLSFSGQERERESEHEGVERWGGGEARERES